jgi:hypothetical protein
MKNKLGTTIILILMMILGVFTYKIISNKQMTTPAYKNISKEQMLQEIQMKILNKKQNPDILLSEFKNTGLLVVYTGKASYKDEVVEKNWYGSKKLDLNLTYNFGYAYDFKEIEIEEFEGTVPVIHISKQLLSLNYCDLDNTSTVQGTKTWLSKNFSPNDTWNILRYAKTDTINYIVNNQEILDKAYNSLQEQIKTIAQKLGYDDVKFI